MKRKTYNNGVLVILGISAMVMVSIIAFNVLTEPEPIIISGGEMPYFHYTKYQDHLNIRLHENCKQINSAYENYSFYVCDEVK